MKNQKLAVLRPYSAWNIRGSTCVSDNRCISAFRLILTTKKQLFEHVICNTIIFYAFYKESYLLMLFLLSFTASKPRISKKSIVYLKLGHRLSTSGSDGEKATNKSYDFPCVMFVFVLLRDHRPWYHWNSFIFHWNVYGISR